MRAFFYKFRQYKTMHPAAIKYGLENDMIQLHREKVVFSDEFLEHISAAARDELGGKRINGSELLDVVIDRGLGKMPIGYSGRRGEANSFYANLNVLIFETMFPYAERAGIGYRIKRSFYFTRQFAYELTERKRILRPLAEEDRDYVKAAFLACHDAVVARCERVIPEDRRHFDLLTLCLFEVYESIMMTNFLERFGGAT
jgi:hypothetical protein